MTGVEPKQMLQILVGRLKVPHVGGPANRVAQHKRRRRVKATWMKN